MIIIFIISLGRSGQTAWGKKLGIVVEKNFYHASVGKIRRRIEAAQKQHKYFYGEVSHFHLRFLPKLKEVFPDAYFLHSVRNGKDAVTSWFYIRKIWSPAWLGLENIIKGFNKMGKFEKICHMWNHWNREADKIVEDRVRIEDLEDFLPIGNPDEPKKSIMKHNTKWTKKQKETFERICGDLHRKYGYDEAHSYDI